MGSKQPKRVPILRNVVKWSPFLLLPFGVMFAETWLQLQVLRNDYRDVELTEEIRRVEQEIEDLRARQADLEKMRRLEEFAPKLGLVEPEHGQVEVVKVRPDEPVPGEDPLTYALRTAGAVR